MTRRFREIGGQRNASRIGSLVAIAGAVLVIWGMTLGSTAKGAAFSCEDRVLVNHNRALEAMPDNRLPGGAGLPFGPSNLELRPGPSIMVEGEPVIYTLGLRGQLEEDGRTARPAGLGWTITMRLDSVDRVGRPKGMSGRRRWIVRRLSDHERQFKLSTDEPGLYRVLVTIEKHGRTRARYRQFLQVLPRKEKLSIRIQGDSPYRLGTVVTARVENWGTVEADAPTGTGLSAERFENGSWKAVEASGSPSVMFEDPEFLPRGRASGCSYFPIPVNSVPGEFRFSTVVQSESGNPRRIFERFAVS